MAALSVLVKNMRNFLIEFLTKSICGIAAQNAYQTFAFFALALTFCTESRRKIAVFPACAMAAFLAYAAFPQRRGWLPLWRTQGFPSVANGCPAGGQMSLKTSLVTSRANGASDIECDYADHY